LAAVQGLQGGEAMSKMRDRIAFLERRLAWANRVSTRRHELYARIDGLEAALRERDETIKALLEAVSVDGAVEADVIRWLEGRGKVVLGKNEEAA
jgi:hypothetical protein